MAGSSGFSVSIGLVDRASDGLDALNKRLMTLAAPAERFNKSMAKFGETSGINRSAGSMQQFGDRALASARAIERMAGPMGRITSLASIAGVAEMSRRWAEAGNRISKTSYLLNTPPARLSSLQGAAALAGVSVDSLNSSLAGLGNTLGDARFARPGAQTALFNAKHIRFTTLDGGARSGADALGDIADLVKNLNEPHAQGRLLETFGMSTDLLPL
jgi:hypothetical protein